MKTSKVCGVWSHRTNSKSKARHSVVETLEGRTLLSTSPIYLTGMSLYDAGANSSGQIGQLPYEYTTNSSAPIADVDRVSVSQGSSSEQNAISFALNPGANTFAFSNVAGQGYPPGAFEGVNLFFSGSSASYNPNSATGVAGSLSVVASTTSSTFKIIPAGTPVLSYTSLGSSAVPFFSTPANGKTSFAVGTVVATVTAMTILNGGPSGSMTITVGQVAPNIVLTAPAAQTATAHVSKSFALGSFTQSSATGPFKVDVNWGDGSADSILTVAAAGTIPATAHTFANAATESITETVTDAKSDISNKPTFTVRVSPLIAGSINGTVYLDANKNNKKDTGEPGLVGAVVYLDLNNNGKIDADEPEQITTSSGTFSFSNVPVGNVSVSFIPPVGYIFELGGTGLLTTVAANKTSVVNFPDVKPLPPTIAITGDTKVIANNSTVASTSNETAFGTVNVGSSLTHTFTIANTGDSALLLSGTTPVTLTGMDAGQFRILAQPPASIAPGTHVTFKVEYAPFIDNTASAYLIIKSNDKTNTTYSFAIGGTGHGFGNVVVGSDMQSVNAVAADAAGDKFVTGSFVATTANTDIFIAKYSPAGKLDWVADFAGGSGTEEGTAIAIDAAGDVYAAGEFSGSVSIGGNTLTAADSGSSPFIVKLTTSGSVRWADCLPGTSFSTCAVTAIAVDHTGNVVTVGTFEGEINLDPGTGEHNVTSFSGVGDAFISKLSSDGKYVWGDYVGATSAPTGSDAGDTHTDIDGVALDSTGNAFIVGNYVGSVDLDPGLKSHLYSTQDGESNGFIVKVLSTSGVSAWSKTTQPGSGTFNILKKVAIDSSGALYVSGEFLGAENANPSGGTFAINSPNSGTYIDKLDDNGKFLWAKVFVADDGDNNCTITAIAVGHDGSLYLSGNFSEAVDFDPGPGTFTIRGTETKDVFICKLTSSGDFVDAESIGQNYGSLMGVTAMAIAGTGDVVVTGYFVVESAASGKVDFDPGTGTDLFTSPLKTDASFIVDLTAQAAK